MRSIELIYFLVVVHSHEWFSFQDARNVETAKRNPTIRLIERTSLNLTGHTRSEPNDEIIYSRLTRFPILIFLVLFGFFN